MKTQSTADTVPQLSKGADKIENAKNDFIKMMSQIEPFLRKSDIIFNTTEGKWFDTTTVIEKEIPQLSVYR